MCDATCNTRQHRASAAEQLKQCHSMHALTMSLLAYACPVLLATGCLAGRLNMLTGFRALRTGNSQNQGSTVKILLDQPSHMQHACLLKAACNSITNSITNGITNSISIELSRYAHGTYVQP